MVGSLNLSARRSQHALSWDLGGSTQLYLGWVSRGFTQCLSGWVFLGFTQHFSGWFLDGFTSCLTGVRWVLLNEPATSPEPLRCLASNYDGRQHELRKAPLRSSIALLFVLSIVEAPSAKYREPISLHPHTGTTDFKRPSLLPSTFSRFILPSVSNRYSSGIALKSSLGRLSGCRSRGRYRYRRMATEWSTLRSGMHCHAPPAVRTPLTGMMCLLLTSVGV